MLPDAKIVDTVRSELQHIMGIGAEPVFARVYRWEKAIPQYNVGHSDRLRGIDASLKKHPGLYLTGKLVEQVLRGQVSVSSAPGRGSTFTLRIPRRLAAGSDSPRGST